MSKALVIPAETTVAGTLKSQSHIVIEGAVMYTSTFKDDYAISSNDNINILKDATVFGHVKSSKDVVVEGYVNGNIDADGVVFLSENASVRGSITASRVEIAENVTFKGVVNLKERVRVSEQIPV